MSHNLKIRASKNLKCHKDGQTCQENQNGKTCVTMFLMNHQNNQPTKKVQWVEILSDSCHQFHESFLQSPLYESFVQQPIPNLSFVQFRNIFNQHQNSE